MKEANLSRNQWPSLPRADGGLFRGISRAGRCFHHIPLDDVAGLIGEMLRDDYGTVISVTVRLDPLQPSLATVATGEIPDAWMPYDHGYSPQLTDYLKALAQLVREGEETENPQQLLAHVEGWFALTSRRTMKLPLDRRRFPALAY
ncbi:hypothetical protein J2T60_000623 [Natronospira proteinivora]|uniref:Uncharacterized protein n=1 Tax=Natronospira proteinivora TaxID=1807133 RepID=A0ABT1G5U0_9GAMM|nr:hypothetical protein [Natronospira proteinivora]MCP1726658.1 hypothetical protein [Natronospira proteinivora]